MNSREEMNRSMVVYVSEADYEYLMKKADGENVSTSELISRMISKSVQDEADRGRSVIHAGMKASPNEIKLLKTVAYAKRPNDEPWPCDAFHIGTLNRCLNKGFAVQVFDEELHMNVVHVTELGRYWLSIDRAKDAKKARDMVRSFDMRGV